MVVHLTTQGARAQLHQGRLHVTHQGETLAHIPLHHLQEVVVWGRVHLTTPLLTTLAARGIPVIFLTRRGAFRARLMGAGSPHVGVRQAQYRAVNDPAWVLAVSRDVLMAKLAHQRLLLQRQRRREADDPDAAAALARALERLGQAMDALQRTDDMTALRGIEGRAARAYFAALRSRLPGWCGLAQRRRRPPRDPANALLSLGYTLLTQRMVSATLAAGLDPYVGFLHQRVYGRPALALDMVEPFRPVVDGVVLRLCRGDELRPGDFQVLSTGTRLTDAGLRRVLDTLERRWRQPVRPRGEEVRRPLGQWLVHQARRFARHLRHGEPGYPSLRFG